MTQKLAKDIKPGERRKFDLKFQPAGAAAMAEIEQRFKMLGEEFPEGYVAGYASTPDLDGAMDVVAPGAFDAAIKERGLMGPRGIKLLIGHNSEKMAGVIKVLETRGDKLWIEAQMNLEVSYVRDAYLVTKDNGGVSFSVGFKPQEWEWKTIEGSDAEYIQWNKADLFEVSIVTFPMNEAATMNFIKSQDTNGDGLEPESFDTASKFEKALVADGMVETRQEAHRLFNWAKANVHLLDKPVAPVAPPQPSVTADSLAKMRETLATIKAQLTPEKE